MAINFSPLKFGLRLNIQKVNGSGLKDCAGLFLHCVLGALYIAGYSILSVLPNCLLQSLR